MQPELEAKMKSEHREKYGRFVEQLGGASRLELMLPSVKRPWSELLAEDEDLNNVPLPLWDARHEVLLSVLKNPPFRAWSLCNTVCTLKEAARQIAEKETSHA